MDENISSADIEVVVAIDPGREKCGIAVVQRDGTILSQAIFPLEESLEAAVRWCARYRAARLILGNGTGHQIVLKRLRSLSGLPPIKVIEEKDTTRHARTRYFHDHPPTGWRRLIPLGLQTPPRPVDDYAAVLLAEAYLTSEQGP